MYNVLLQDFENNPRCINWVSMLRNMLCNFGFHDVWLAQGVANVNSFVSLFKQRVMDTFIQHWYSRIENSTRASFYNVFTNFGFSDFLKHVNVKKYRIALTRLLVSSHRLNIETGRWSNIPRNERLCSICNKLEDEYHFLFECKLYDELRVKYIKKYYRSRPSMFKCIDMLQSNSFCILRNLAVYAYNAFELRRQATTV